MTAVDENRDAVVVIAAPAAGWLEGTGARDNGAGGEHLVEDLTVDGLAGVPGTSTAALDASREPCACSRSPSSPRGLSGRSFGPAMKPSSDIDMYTTVALIRVAISYNGTSEPTPRQSSSSDLVGLSKNHPITFHNSTTPRRYSSSGPTRTPL
jgi:hypothetical protein